MSVDFRDLETLAQQNLDSTLSEALASREEQYQDASPEEILELLEEATETFCPLAPKLPPYLQDTARKEIDFFMALYQDINRHSLQIQNPQPPQKIVNLLSIRAS